MGYPYENLDTYTLPVLFNRSVELYGKNDALGKAGQKAMTYAELGDNVKSMINMLQNNGISKGDKVVILSENMPNWAVAYFAITHFGAVAVPVLPDFHPSDVHHILRHSDAQAVFVSDRHLSTIEDCEEDNVKFVINLDSLELVDELTNKDYLDQIKQKTKEGLQKISKSSNEPKEDDLASLLYTSGTTGHSKGVMLSHKNLVTNAMSAFDKIDITDNDVWLSILPLAHTLECTVGMTIPILHGSSVYYIDKVPTPSVLLKSFSIVRPTMMATVPLIIEKIYKNKVLPKFTGSFVMKTLYGIPFFRKKLNKIAGKKLLETFGGRLNFFGVGGAGISPTVEQFLIEANFPYKVGYGLTETAPLLAATDITAGVKLGSTGTAMEGVELAIKDKDPVTGEGEIIARSPSIMMGYFKDEEQTKEVMDDDWFLTGDLGYIDEDGFLFINGRSKNVIIGSGGENIYPEQVESVINKNLAVADSLVMETSSGQLIARIHLDYELIDKKFNADKNPDTQVREDIANFLEEMRVDVNSQISSFSRMVKFVEQIEPFVKTPTKKIKRFLYAE